MNTRCPYPHLCQLSALRRETGHVFPRVVGREGELFNAASPQYSSSGWATSQSWFFQKEGLPCILIFGKDPQDKEWEAGQREMKEEYPKVQVSHRAVSRDLRTPGQSILTLHSRQKCVGIQSTTYSLGHIAGVCLLGMLRFIQAEDSKDGQRVLAGKRLRASRAQHSVTASVQRLLYCETRVVEKQDQHLYGGWSRHDPDRTMGEHLAQYPGEGEPDTHA